MSDNKKRNIITIAFIILILFMWWLSGYDFNTRGKSVGEEFFGICASTAILYVTLPFLLRVNNNNRKR